MMWNAAILISANSHQNYIRLIFKDIKQYFLNIYQSDNYIFENRTFSKIYIRILIKSLSIFFLIAYYTLKIYYTPHCSSFPSACGNINPYERCNARKRERILTTSSSRYESR